MRSDRSGTIIFIRLGVSACVVAAALSGAVGTSRAVRKLSAAATRNASLHFDDREFATGNSIIPDQTVLYMARATIPTSGDYRVITGAEPVKDETNLTRPYASTFATYFLLPRRPSSDARWIICIGCDRAALPAADIVWTDNEGSSLLKVRS